MKANEPTTHRLIAEGLIGYYKESRWIGGEYVILQAGKQELLKRGRK